MGFSRQEYWSGLPFPPPVDHILSSLWPACMASRIASPSYTSLFAMTRLWSMKRRDVPNYVHYGLSQELRHFNGGNPSSQVFRGSLVLPQEECTKSLYFHWSFESGHCSTFVSQVQFMTQGLQWLPLIDEVCVKLTSSGRFLPSLHLGFN